ncbi:lipid-A-disaccharide synthase [bacterium]|nr:lipid-A-disaccharide synthase [bacterium]
MKEQVLVVTGEASGDLLASQLVNNLRARNRELEFFGIGGENLQKAGVELLFDSGSLAIIGFGGILRAIPQLLRIRAKLLKEVKKRGTRVAILTDCPDFNLRLAPRLKALDCRIVYYVSPQVWVWRSWRIKKIRRYVDLNLPILPFEEDYFRQRGISNTHYNGHPFVDLVKPGQTREEFVNRNQLPGHFFALLPGSRRREIIKIFPLMIEAFAGLSRRIPDLYGVIPVAPGLPMEMLEHFIPGSLKNVKLLRGCAHEVESYADFGIVASGSATLECALLNLPMVSVYSTDFWTYHIAKRLLKIPYVSLVNLVAGRMVIPELIQRDLTPANLIDKVLEYWNDGSKLAAMRTGLEEVRIKLGAPGAAERSAEIITKQFFSDRAFSMSSVPGEGHPGGTGNDFDIK